MAATAMTSDIRRRSFLAIFTGSVASARSRSLCARSRQLSATWLGKKGTVQQPPTIRTISWVRVRHRFSTEICHQGLRRLRARFAPAGLGRLLRQQLNVICCGIHGNLQPTISLYGQTAGKANGIRAVIGSRGNSGEACEWHEDKVIRFSSTRPVVVRVWAC